MVLRYKKKREKHPLTIPFKAIKMLLFSIEILKAYESTQFTFIGICVHLYSGSIFLKNISLCVYVYN